MTVPQIPPPPNLMPDELRQFISQVQPDAKLPRNRVALMLAMLAKNLQQLLARPQLGVVTRVETRPDGFTLHADIVHPAPIDDDDVQLG